MIKEAMQYIASLKEEAMEPQIIDIAGKTYCNKDLKLYDEEPMAVPIGSTTLSAMVDYIKSCSKELREDMILHVVRPTEVKLYSGLTEDRTREYLFQCNAQVPGFEFDRWYDQERFLIETQANFEMAGDMNIILQVAGNVESNATANYGDDGVSQKTTIHQGIASKADVIVPNPVTLVPYRTFLEVEQPSSQFVFRIKDQDGQPAFKIVEAEGGLWKNEAMKSIKYYFAEQIPEDLKKRITIIA
ncbi:hypothetical protein [Muricomes intestini]|jgi:hypothetical protein|uniref:hypothetical protein n=1 Tax=Muricomes intestini TaxID=1796634 RepID=UPI002FE21785